MKAKHIAAGSIAVLTIGLSAAFAYAHPGGGFGPGMMHGMGPGPQGGFAGPAAVQQLMTREERTALIQKMRTAQTPEERQKLAEATHAEMQKRAKDAGMTLPEHRGPGAGFRPGFAPPVATPNR